MKPKTSLEYKKHKEELMGEIKDLFMGSYTTDEIDIIVDELSKERLADQKAKMLSILVDVLNYDAVTKQEKEIVCIIEEKIRTSWGL